MSAPWEVAVVRVTRIGHEGPELWRAWASRVEVAGETRVADFRSIAEGAEDVVRAAAGKWRRPRAMTATIVAEEAQVAPLRGER